MGTSKYSTLWRRKDEEEVVEEEEETKKNTPTHPHTHSVSAADGSSFSLAPITTLADHDGLVSSVVAVGKECVVTGSWDCSVRLWNLQCPSRPIQVVRAHTDHVTALCCWGSGGGNVKKQNGGGKEEERGGQEQQQLMVASASKDRTVKLWDVRAPTAGSTITSHMWMSVSVCMRLLEGLTQIPLALAWGGGGREGEGEGQGQHLLSVGMDDGSVGLVDIRKPGGFVCVQKVHGTRASVVRFAPSSSSFSSLVLASGGDDAKVKVTPLFMSEGNGSVSFGESVGMEGEEDTGGDYVRALGWLPSGGAGKDDASMTLLRGSWDGNLRAMSWKKESERNRGKRWEKRGEWKLMKF